MSMPGSRVPVSLRLAVRLLPAEVREEVLGDLLEHWHLRVRNQHWFVRVAWAWRQPVTVLITRLRFSRRSHERRTVAGGRNTGLGVSWLDFKLGFRMLVRYPGLTLVGGLGMTFAIWIGAGTFEFVTQVLYPTLPLDDGDRVVGIQLVHTQLGEAQEQALFDFVTWREELESVEDLGAFRTLRRNLITGDGQGEPVTVAEINVSGFRVARVPPLVGRSLVEGDEQAGAPAVVVIGYDVWQNRFEGDPEVVGRTVRLGSAQPTVVGVMPEGFEFPIFHNVWVPLRLNVLDHDRLQGPGIYVFGRLAPGATLDQAQAELNTLGRRAAAEFPDTHEYLSPQVMPYAQSVLRIPPRVWRAFSAGLLSSNLAPTMLLLLICANVALLIFARAASRESELVVRNALGASRARIVGQLFVEALVLGGVAAIIGLAAAAIGLRWGLTFVESVVLEGQPLPFWFDASLSSASILYAGLFTVLGAVVAGVVPGLKVTGGIGARLKEATAGGGGLQFGGVWTAVIVTQVALTVAFPAVALIMQSNRVRIESVDFEIPAEEYLTGRLEMDREALSTASVDTSRAAFLARYGTTLEELERRLASDAAVTGVTFADLLPRMYHPWNQIEMEEGAVEPPDARGHRVGRASVALNYFEEFDAPIISGRGFNSSDLSPDERVVIVNNTFVRRVLGGRNPIGQRVRHVADESSRVPSFDGPWYEIVGVVRDLGTTSGYGESGIYHPVALADTYPLHVALHVRGEPESFAPQLRTAASELDATLRLHDLMPLNEAVRDDVNFYDFWFRLTTFVSSITLFLSLAGIFAVMSFTVSRRTREIGVRVALGADARQVVTGIFRKPLAQVGLGVLVGTFLVAGMLTSELFGRPPGLREVGLITVYAALMMGVCMLSCIVPTRRALRIEPTEALRADG